MQWSKPYLYHIDYKYKYRYCIEVQLQCTVLVLIYAGNKRSFQSYIQYKIQYNNLKLCCLQNWYCTCTVRKCLHSKIRRPCSPTTKFANSGQISYCLQSSNVTSLPVPVLYSYRYSTGMISTSALPVDYCYNKQTSYRMYRHGAVEPPYCLNIQTAHYR